MGDEELLGSIAQMVQQVQISSSSSSTISSYFFVPFLFFIAFIIFLWFAVGILICLWVYNDAKSRGMEGAIWVLIVLVANVLGLIVYLIIREERRPQPPFPAQAATQVRFCKNCGQELKLGANFCSSCGKPTA
jgi:hypothetical protein